MNRELKQKIMVLVKDDLAAIEAALAENLTPHLELVKNVASHILFAGGKRLRPLLMVLCARICGYRGSYDKTFSTIFEYLHAATLLHDDLIDGAATRRGRTVANRLWDPATVVLVGDFLLARSLSIAARTGIPEVISVISHITEEMSQGEIHQLMRKGSLDLSEAEYLNIIRRKTAVLFQGACRISALIADAPKAVEEALAAFGFNLGMAFQMADDLLDYTLDSRMLGKGVGADLKEGKLTLPVIYALLQADSVDRRQLTKIISDPGLSEQDFKFLIGRLERLGGIAYTRNQAETYIIAAKEALSIFEEGQTKQILLHLADYALAREA
jgi:octaprenyl-diphosphate synthase